MPWPTNQAIEKPYLLGRCLAGVATLFTAFGGLFVGDKFLFVAGSVGFLSAVMSRKVPKPVLALMLAAAIVYIGAMGYFSVSYYFQPHVAGNDNPWLMHLLLCIPVGFVAMELLQQLRLAEAKNAREK